MKRYIKNVDSNIDILNSTSIEHDVDSMSLDELLAVKHKYTKGNGMFGSFHGHQEAEYFMQVVLRLEEEFGYEI